MSNSAGQSSGVRVGCGFRVRDSRGWFGADRRGRRVLSLASQRWREPELDKMAGAGCSKTPKKRAASKRMRKGTRSKAKPKQAKPKRAKSSCAKRRRRKSAAGKKCMPMPKAKAKAKRSAKKPQPKRKAARRKSC
ncbi:histone H1-II-like [Drosophila madeirensis]|uniref:Histone H1-II-like n=1 Tax=Drosophila madeirensis TaxID=30013 RepID=A0AAU9G2A4_DROMD